MSRTRPTADQVRFNSSANGEVILDDYMEAAEKGGRSVPDLLSELFANDGNLKNFIDIREDPLNSGTFQIRLGTYVDPEAGWTTFTYTDFDQLYADAIAARDAALAAQTASETAQGLSESAALASQSASVASGAAQIAAEAAQTAAELSETNAATSESNAATSEANALASENKAQDWAEHPEDTEVDPGQYSSLHHAAKSADSAAAALASQGAAATSASNAATSASNASTSEGNAATSESNAATSAANALTSENNAATSEAKAQDWANELEDVEVETGLYSAFHWAQKALAATINVVDVPADGNTVDGISANWAFDHENAADPHSQYIIGAEVHDTPSDGATTSPISSNWAYDITNGNTSIPLAVATSLVVSNHITLNGTTPYDFTNWNFINEESIIIADNGNAYIRLNNSEFAFDDEAVELNCNWYLNNPGGYLKLSDGRASRASLLPAGFYLDGALDGLAGTAVTWAGYFYAEVSDEPYQVLNTNSKWYGSDVAQLDVNGSSGMVFHGNAPSWRNELTTLAFKHAAINTDNSDGSIRITSNVYIDETDNRWEFTGNADNGSELDITDGWLSFYHFGTGAAGDPATSTTPFTLNGATGDLSIAGDLSLGSKITFNNASHQAWGAGYDVIEFNSRGAIANLNNGINKGATYIPVNAYWNGTEWKRSEAYYSSLVSVTPGGDMWFQYWGNGAADETLNGLNDEITSLDFRSGTLWLGSANVVNLDSQDFGSSGAPVGLGLGDGYDWYDWNYEQTNIRLSSAGGITAKLLETDAFIGIYSNCYDSWNGNVQWTLAGETQPAMRALFHDGVFSIDGYGTAGAGNGWTDVGAITNSFVFDTTTGDLSADGIIRTPQRVRIWNGAGWSNELDWALHYHGVDLGVTSIVGSGANSYQSNNAYYDRVANQWKHANTGAAVVKYTSYFTGEIGWNWFQSATAGTSVGISSPQFEMNLDYPTLSLARNEVQILAHGPSGSGTGIMMDGDYAEYGPEDGVWIHLHGFQLNVKRYDALAHPVEFLFNSFRDYNSDLYYANSAKDTRAIGMVVEDGLVSWYDYGDGPSSFPHYSPISNPVETFRFNVTDRIMSTPQLFIGEPWTLDTYITNNWLWPGPSYEEVEALYLNPFTIGFAQGKFRIDSAFAYNTSAQFVHRGGEGYSLELDNNNGWLWYHVSAAGAKTAHFWWDMEFGRADVNNVRIWGGFGDNTYNGAICMGFWEWIDTNRGGLCFKNDAIVSTDSNTAPEVDWYFNCFPEEIAGDVVYNESGEVDKAFSINFKNAIITYRYHGFGNTGAYFTNVSETTDKITLDVENGHIDAAGGISVNGGTERLDNYDEDTMTVAITASTTNPTVTFNSNVAEFTRVGNLIFATIELDIATFSGGSGNIILTGMPAIGKNSTGGAAQVHISDSSAIKLNASSNLITGHVNPNTTDLHLEVLSNTGDFGSAPLTVSDLGTGTLRIALTYRTDT